MNRADSHTYGHLARLRLASGLALGLAAVVGTGQSFAGTDNAPIAQQAVAQPGAYATTVAYVEQFYPLWFTYYQAAVASHNRLVGPLRVSPLYQIVVAINDDTLYASTFLDLTAQPVILTVPATKVTYSILSLDPYGDILSSGIPSLTPGTYGLTPPGYTGTLPAGVTPIAMPLNFSILIFRADKYSATGQKQIAQAEAFRASLKMQPLSNYLSDPSAGGALVLPEAFFAVPFKTAADTLIKEDPITFLKLLQIAVAKSNIAPLSASALALSNRFNTLFGTGDFTNTNTKYLFTAGAQTAHDMILDRYLTHTGPTNWVNFTNIGAWGDNFIERSSITEFIQLGNAHATAAYFQAFNDGAGVPLDGSIPRGYVLTFPKGALPEAKRFWSLTAYTPESIELIKNSAKKYEVASYTPGLKYNADGSLSVYITRQIPPGVAAANWLPVSTGLFNIMLRVYGPEGAVASNKYIPPGIAKR